MPIDPKLQLYLDLFQEKLKKQHGKDCIPCFCSEYSSDLSKKRMLAVLQDPGKSGAERSCECSIYNHDQTSRNQWRIIIDDLEFDPAEILFWNFYPYYEISKRKFRRAKKNVSWTTTPSKNVHIGLAILVQHFVCQSTKSQFDLEIFPI